jgi:hypothetical protein
MNAGKMERSTLAGEKRTADAAAEDSGPQTADERRRTEDEGDSTHRPIDVSPPLRLCHSALPALFPTETEIYILPDGQVLFADLPAELADLAAQLGSVLPCAVERESDRGLGIGDWGSG